MIAQWVDDALVPYGGYSREFLGIGVAIYCLVWLIMAVCVFVPYTGKAEAPEVTSKA